MELDTGSSVSVISEADYVKYFKGEKLEKSLLVLKTYSGEKLHSLGVVRVQVQYNDQCSYLKLYVVKRGGPALFGREWLKSIQLVPDFFFCGHPALHERECYLEHSAILLHLSSRSPLQLQFLMLYLEKVL
jgi:hypothetical protein